MNLAKYTSVATLLAALSAAPAFSAAHMAGCDADGDATVTQEEFDTCWQAQGSFGTWDADAGGDLNEEEFTAGAADGDWGDFATWDADASGGLSEDEFNTGAFGTFDADASGDLNAEEVA